MTEQLLGTLFNKSYNDPNKAKLTFQLRPKHEIKWARLANLTQKGLAYNLLRAKVTAHGSHQGGLYIHLYNIRDKSRACLIEPSRCYQGSRSCLVRPQTCPRYQKSSIRLTNYSICRSNLHVQNIKCTWKAHLSKQSANFPAGISSSHP